MFRDFRGVLRMLRGVVSLSGVFMVYGSLCPNLSRLVRRYSSFSGVFSLIRGIRSLIFIPCASRLAILSGLLVIRRIVSIPSSCSISAAAV